MISESIEMEYCHEMGLSTLTESFFLQQFQECLL